MRRLTDILVASVGALMLTPVIAGLALLIGLTMGRPVFFVQHRSGLGGVPFRLVKFRTMVDARDPSGRPLHDADRTTALGGFLRRRRLDELPELWNVLKGEMSLIGPRPLLPGTVGAMGELGRRRGAVRPGLTGWAQVNGNALLSEQAKLALDLWYIEHRSLRLDILIVIKTVQVILFGERINQAEVRRVHAHGHRRGS